MLGNLQVLCYFNLKEKLYRAVRSSVAPVAYAHVKNHAAMFFMYVLLAIGAVFALFGAYMWKSNKAFRIKGYDLSEIKDTKGLSAWFGKCIIAYGLMISLPAVWGLAAGFGERGLIVIVLTNLVFSKIGLAVMIGGIEKYKVKSGGEEI